MAEQLVEVVCADIVWVVAEGGDARVDLLGPLLVGLDDGQGVELGVGRAFAGGVAVQPAVDVDARPLWRVSWYSQRGGRVRTEEPASRTTPYRPTARNSSVDCGMRGARAAYTFPWFRTGSKTIGTRPCSSCAGIKCLYCRGRVRGAAGPEKQSGRV
jgi:hypothetical protein